MEKHVPQIGEHLYLRQQTGLYYVDLCKRPYTCVDVIRNKAGEITKAIIQECQLIYYGPRYYDTIADEIKANPSGRLVTLAWSKKYERWQETPTHCSKYAEFAVWGEWQDQPYLD